MYFILFVDNSKSISHKNKISLSLDAMNFTAEQIRELLSSPIQTLGLMKDGIIDAHLPEPRIPAVFVSKSVNIPRRQFELKQSRRENTPIPVSTTSTTNTNITTTTKTSTTPIVTPLVIQTPFPPLSHTTINQSNAIHPIVLPNTIPTHTPTPFPDIGVQENATQPIELERPSTPINVSPEREIHEQPSLARPKSFAFTSRPLESDFVMIERETQTTKQTQNENSVVLEQPIPETQTITFQKPEQRQSVNLNRSVNKQVLPTGVQSVQLKKASTNNNNNHQNVKNNSTPSQPAPKGFGNIKSFWQNK